MSTIPPDLDEPTLSAKAMVGLLYDEIMREQQRTRSLRDELVQALHAGNANRVGVVNMQWFGSKIKLAAFYRLWNNYTGEEFKP